MNILHQTVLIASLIAFITPSQVHARLGSEPELYQIDIKGLESVQRSSLERRWPDDRPVYFLDGTEFTGQSVDKDGRHENFYFDGKVYGPSHYYESSAGYLRSIHRYYGGSLNGWTFDSRNDFELYLDHAIFGRSANFQKGTPEQPMLGGLDSAKEYHWAVQDGFTLNGVQTTTHQIGGIAFGASFTLDGDSSWKKLRGLNIDPKQDSEEPLPKEIETFHENGKLQARMLFKDNKPHGKFVYGNNQGIVLAIIPFENGLRHGSEKRWYSQLSPDGKPVLKTERQLIQGRYHGTERYWDFNGVLRLENEFQENLLNGLTRIWNAKGELIIQSNYEAGILNGKETYFLNDGTALVLDRKSVV